MTAKPTKTTNTMTIKEYSDKFGKNPEIVRKLIHEGRLKATKIKNKWQIAVEEGQIESYEEARTRKIIAEANLKEQQSLKWEKLKFQEWTDLFFNTYCEEFANFNNEVVSCKLDRTTTERLNKVFNQCLLNLSTKLKSITSSASLLPQ